MTVEDVKLLGYDNTIPFDPYQYVHIFGPSIYKSNKDSTKWYFYFQGQEIYVDKEELTQILRIFSKQEISDAQLVSIKRLKQKGIDWQDIADRVGVPFFTVMIL